MKNNEEKLTFTKKKYLRIARSIIHILFKKSIDLKVYFNDNVKLQGNDIIIVLNGGDGNDRNRTFKINTTVYEICRGLISITY